MRCESVVCVLLVISDHSPRPTPPAEVCCVGTASTRPTAHAPVSLRPAYATITFRDAQIPWAKLSGLSTADWGKVPNELPGRVLRICGPECDVEHSQAIASAEVAASVLVTSYRLGR